MSDLPDYDEAEDRRGGQPAPIMEHLEELRRRIIYIIIAAVIGVAIGWTFTGDLYRYLIGSLNQIAPGTKVTQIGFTEVFWVQFSLGAWSGLILVSPFILYQIIAFVLPALTPPERRYLFIMLPSTILAFAVGATFAFVMVLPLIARFFLGLTVASHTEYIVTPRQYIDLIKGLIVPFGAVFELPLVVWLLARLGVVTAALLRRVRKLAILVIFVLAALLSPGPDIVTQLSMAIPMFGLYEASIWLAKLAERQRERADG